MYKNNSNQESFCSGPSQNGTNITNSSFSSYPFFSSTEISHFFWNLFLFHRQNKINHEHSSQFVEPNNLVYQQPHPYTDYQQNCQTLWGNYPETLDPLSYQQFTGNGQIDQQPSYQSENFNEYQSEDSHNTETCSKEGPETENNEAIECFKGISRNSQNERKNVCKTKLSKQSLDWNDEMDKLLLDCVSKYKRDWNKVENYFKKNVCKLTIHALKNRYRHLKGDPYQLRVKFNHLEDLKIAEYFSKYGTDWDRVADYFPSRTKQMIKNRYYSHIHKKGLLPQLLQELNQSALFSDTLETTNNQNVDSTSPFLGESPISDSKIKVLPNWNMDFCVWNPESHHQLSYKVAPFME